MANLSKRLFDVNDEECQPGDMIEYQRVGSLKKSGVFLGIKTFGFDPVTSTRYITTGGLGPIETEFICVMTDTLTIDYVSFGEYCQNSMKIAIRSRATTESSFE